jgi:AraC-like DNA-binding protein
MSNIFLMQQPRWNRPHHLASITLRVLEIVRDRIHNGEWTERRLARTTGWSQSHMHRMLRGSSTCGVEAVDSLIVALRIDPVDIWGRAELARWIAQPNPDSYYPQIQAAA